MKLPFPQAWVCRGLGLASGLLWALPQLWPAAAPLQAVALLPLLFGLWRGGGASMRLAAAMGAYAGVAYALPQAVATLMPPLIAAGLVAWCGVLMTAFSLGAAGLLRRNTLPAALAVGPLLAVLDWLNFTAVPVWGLAQSLVRPWSSYPEAVQFVAVTGVTGIALGLGAVQGVAVFLARNPHRHRPAAWAMFLVVACFWGLDLAANPGRPTGSLTVAAVGWPCGRQPHDAPPFPSSANDPTAFEELVSRPVATAAARGARLIVLPEAAMTFGRAGAEPGQELLARFRPILARHRVVLAVGYFDETAGLNRLAFLGPGPQVTAEYVKTHLTPYEHYASGDGRLATFVLDGAGVGGMICHDDNFARLPRAYARQGANVVAVPTSDWLTVRHAHFQSSIFRAVECRYAVVRAAAGGLSAIVSPTGEVLALADHFEEGPRVLVAEVPLYGPAGPTPFARFGHWLVVPCAAWLALLALRSLADLRAGRR